MLLKKSEEEDDIKGGYFGNAPNKVILISCSGECDYLHDMFSVLQVEQGHSGRAPGALQGGRRGTPHE